MKRKKIDDTNLDLTKLPKHFVQRFGQVGFSKVGQYLVPVLCLSPNDVDERLREHWFSKNKNQTKKNSPLYHLVLRYGKTQPADRYGWLLDFVPYEEAQLKKHHQLPQAIRVKIENNEPLNSMETFLVIAFAEVEKALVLDPSKRYAYQLSEINAQCTKLNKGQSLLSNCELKKSIQATLEKGAQVEHDEHDNNSLVVNTTHRLISELKEFEQAPTKALIDDGKPELKVSEQESTKEKDAKANCTKANKDDNDEQSFEVKTNHRKTFSKHKLSRSPSTTASTAVNPTSPSAKPLTSINCATTAKVVKRNEPLHTKKQSGKARILPLRALIASKEQKPQLPKSKDAHIESEFTLEEINYDRPRPIPSWLTVLPSGALPYVRPGFGFDFLSYFQDRQRRLGAEFCEAVPEEWPQTILNKVNTTAYILNVEQAIFDWAQNPDNQRKFIYPENYWEKIRYVVSGLSGRNETCDELYMPELVKRMLQGEYQTAMDLVSLPNDDFYDSMKNLL